MAFTKRTLLRMLEDAGGATTSYPFIETGHQHLLEEFLRDGLVVRTPKKGDWDEMRITERGREWLAEPEIPDPGREAGG